MPEKLRYTNIFWQKNYRYADGTFCQRSSRYSIFSQNNARHTDGTVK